MFNFFHTVFGGITSLIASAIIAVGMVSAPPPESTVQLSQLPQQSKNEDILSTQEIKIQKIEEQKNEITPKPVLASASTPKPVQTSAPTPAVFTETQIIAKDFLSNPTLANLKIFCEKAGNILTSKTKQVLNADRTELQSIVLSLSETIEVCKALNFTQANPHKNGYYYIFIAPIQDTLIIPLNNSDSDQQRLNKINWNNKLREYNKTYKLYYFSDIWYKNIMDPMSENTPSLIELRLLFRSLPELEIGRLVPNHKSRIDLR